MVARKASTLCYNNQHLNLIPIVIVSFFFFDLMVTVAIVVASTQETVLSLSSSSQCNYRHYTIDDKQSSMTDILSSPYFTLWRAGWHLQSQLKIVGTLSTNGVVFFFLPVSCPFQCCLSQVNFAWDCTSYLPLLCIVIIIVVQITASMSYAMRLVFLVGSLPCSDRFFPGTPVFSSPQKPPLVKSNSIWNTRTRLTRILKT